MNINIKYCVWSSKLFKRIFKKIWTSNAMLYIHIHSYPASVLFNMIQIKSLYLPLVCHFFGCNIFIFNNIKAIYFCLYIFLIYCFIIEANQNLLSWIAFLLLDYCRPEFNKFNEVAIFCSRIVLTLCNTQYIV